MNSSRNQAMFPGQKFIADSESEVSKDKKRRHRGGRSRGQRRKESMMRQLTAEMGLKMGLMTEKTKMVDNIKQLQEKNNSEF